MLYQMIIPVTLGIAATSRVGRVGHLLAVRRHSRLLVLLLLLLLLLLQLLLLLGMVLRHYSTTHRIRRVGGVDCQAVTITLPRPSFSL